MTVLKNSDRDEVIRRVLTEAFAPRFSAMQNEVRALIQKKVEKDHPEFAALVKSPIARQYLAETRVRDIYLESEGDAYAMAAPVYGRCSSMPTGRLHYGDREPYSAFSDGETAVPGMFGEFKVSDVAISEAYRKAWSDYAAAYLKVNSLLHSYAVREKFTADFPEFAKYLPGVTVRAKLPAVIVKNVREELYKFGIPAQ